MTSYVAGSERVCAVRQGLQPYAVGGHRVEGQSGGRAMAWRKRTRLGASGTSPTASG